MTLLFVIGPLVVMPLLTVCDCALLTGLSVAGSCRKRDKRLVVDTGLVEPGVAVFVRAIPELMVEVPVTEPVDDIGTPFVITDVASPTCTEGDGVIAAVVPDTAGVIVATGSVLLVAVTVPVAVPEGMTVVVLDMTLVGVEGVRDHAAFGVRPSDAKETDDGDAGNVEITTVRSIPMAENKPRRLSVKNEASTR
jgi:hypothetical protein